STSRASRYSDTVVDPVTLAVKPGLAPAVSLGADAGALAAATSTLRVYTFAGDVLSLGRYHVLPSGGGETRVRLHRRHTGGRAVAFGDGFVGIALTLPHRSALVAAEPLALAPEQVMNRCVRGALEAHVAVEDDTIADVMLAGDFIANSPAIAALEDALRRGRAERPPIEDAVRRVFGQPANFILGVGPVDTVAETIVRALAA